MNFTVLMDDETRSYLKSMEIGLKAVPDIDHLNMIVLKSLEEFKPDMTTLSMILFMIMNHEGSVQQCFDKRDPDDTSLN